MELGQICMIRAGGFGEDFAPKLWISFLTLLLVLWDVGRHRRADYGWVLLFGALSWSMVEIVLERTGMRWMPVRQIYGVPLPLWASALLQGMSEGAFVAVFGLFLGDRLLPRSTRAWAIIGFLAFSALLFALVAHGSSDLPGSPPTTSRRNMVALPALCFLGVLTAVSLAFLWLWNEHRQRAAAMLLAMAGLATVWTLAQLVAGVRWIEVSGAAPGTWQPAPIPIAALAFAFDIVVEICLAYLPFFAVPAMLGLCRDGRSGLQPLENAAGCKGQPFASHTRPR